MHSRPLRIVHLTVCRDLPSSIRKQIKWEHSASRRLKDVEWFSLVVHGGIAVEPFEKRIPPLFRPMFLRNLYGWLIAQRLSRTHDLLLLRHMPFDPFALIFAPLIRNRVSVHHSREWLELPLIRSGIVGRLAGSLEMLTGFVSVRCARGVMGVTNEIAHFQVNCRSPGKPAGLYANGIDLSDVQEALDLRDASFVKIVFMSNTFSEWHGLDRLVDAVRDIPVIPTLLSIEIIGNLSEPLKKQISALGSRAKIFRIHGFLDTEAYQNLLAAADVGLGSLAMDRQNLYEGSTLKVREMLAMGLPVYSGHVDTSLPPEFPFYHKASVVDIEALVGFARAMKSYSRSEIRAAAAPFIDKASTMQVAVDWLNKLSASVSDNST
jgi:glycosyltransferase involved in cell wall biosynthesis